jgi:hypothetical protein
LSQLSTGLSREERRAARNSGANLGAPLIYTYAEAAAVAKISKRTLERMLSDGSGPETVVLSPRRFGITPDALRAWLKKLPRRKAIAPASATTEAHA